MKLSVKLYVAVAALIGAALLLGGVAWTGSNALTQELDESLGKTAKKIDLVNSFRARSWEAETARRNAHLWILLGDANKAADAAQANALALSRARVQLGELQPLLVSEEAAGRSPKCEPHSKSMSR